MKPKQHVIASAILLSITQYRFRHSASRLREFAIPFVAVLRVIRRRQSTLRAENISMQPNTILDRPSNDRYETDIHYTFQFCHWVLKSIGMYPFFYTRSSVFQKLAAALLIAICSSALYFVIVPSGCYILFYEKDVKVKIKFLGPLAFCLTSLFKYGYLGVKGRALGRCIKYVEKDWKVLQDEDHRDIMIKHVSMSRNMIKICAIFLYTGGLSYHTTMPLLSKKTINENFTIRPLTYPGYEVLFDVQESPNYEIVYCMHCFYVLVTGNITMTAYSLTAIFTTHICGQIRVQMLRLGNLKEERNRLGSAIEDGLAIVVKDHVEILRFTRNVDEALRDLFLVEVVVSTLLICLLEYYCMMEWETSDAVAIVTYFILLTSFTFTILIFCYVGELLLAQASEMEAASYDTAWYNLSGRKARAIVLLLAICKYPPKLTAGKLFVLSVKTFGAVLKSSMVYLNLLRTVTE